MDLKNRSNRDDIKLDLTPMVDVVFLLIIFFLIATSFDYEKNIEINLAQSDAKKVSQFKKEFSISIDPKGDFYIDKKQYSKDQLKVKLQNIDKNTPILIKADKESKHQHLIKLMDLLHKLDLTKNLNFITK